MSCGLCSSKKIHYELDMDSIFTVHVQRKCLTDYDPTQNSTKFSPRKNDTYSPSAPH